MPWSGLSDVPSDLADGDDTGVDWSLSGNAGTTPGPHFLGTTDEVTLTLAVSSTAALRIEPNAISPNLIGGYRGNAVRAGAHGATIGGGGTNDYVNLVTDIYGTVGGGLENAAAGVCSTVGGGLDNMSGDYATTGGGWGNAASGLEATIGGGTDNIASGERATVAGGGGNTANARDATVAGGFGNLATDELCTVGGGHNNQAGDRAGTIYDCRYATVAGGRRNIASGQEATIGGGAENQATNNIATVGGGYLNVAGGWGSTVPGGLDNEAAGYASFAAGRRAKALHDGSFVWADDTFVDFSSSAARTFSVRSTGGARFVLAVDGAGNPTWTCSVASEGSWACSSDRDLKEELVEADGTTLLETLAEMPIYYWSAIGSETRHIGPMAQDFAASFGVGGSDTSIATIDLDGVALAAIQGLHAQNQVLEAEKTELRINVDQLTARVEALEHAIGTRSPGAASAPVESTILPGAGIIALATALVWGRRREGGRA